MFRRFLIGFGVALAVLLLGIVFLISVMAMFVFPGYWYVCVGIAVLAMGSSWGLCAAFFPKLFKNRGVS